MSTQRHSRRYTNSLRAQIFFGIAIGLGVVLYRVISAILKLNGIQSDYLSMICVGVVVVVLAVALDTYLRKRRRLQGPIRLCPTCEYDLSGLSDPVVCPECGKLAEDQLVSQSIDKPISEPATPSLEVASASAPKAMVASAELVSLLHNRDIPCIRCGYNLRDLRSPVCPECGWWLDFTTLEFEDRTFTQRQRRLAIASVVCLVTLVVFVAALTVAPPALLYFSPLLVLVLLLVPATLLARVADQQIYLDRQRLKKARSVPSFGVVATPLSWFAIGASCAALAAIAIVALVA